jgi:flagellar biosynthesis protein FliR
MMLSEPEIGALIATFARAAGLAVTAPVLGDRGVSLRPRLVFVVAITALIGVNRAPVAFSALPLVAPLELAIGLVTGTTARIVMSRIAIAGQLMGLSLGLGFASQYDVHAGESAGVMRTLTSTLGGLAFIATGGFEAIVTGASASPAGVSELAALGPAFLHHATAAMGHGLALAAPIVLAALVGNIALAVMNRAAPAVNVFSVALSVVLILGGIALLASAAHLVGGATDTARTAIDVLTGR